MKMKIIIATLLIMLLLATAANAAESVEIRSTVMHADLVLANPFPITASEWAGFYYDLDDNVSTEKLTASAGEKPGTFNFEYVTNPRFKAYESDVLTGEDENGYAILGFFAEPYVALGTNVEKPVAEEQAVETAKINFKNIVVDAQTELDAAQAELDAAQAAFDAAEAITPGTGDQAALDAAQIKYEIAQVVHDATQAELDSVQAELDSVQAELDAAQAELNAAQAELNAAQAELNAAQAAFDAAEAITPGTGDQAALNAAQTELDTAQDDLDTVQADLDAVQDVFDAVQDVFDTTHALDTTQAALDAALTGVRANKISKLVVDDDEKHTLNTGATLEMGNGYSVIVEQIDVDGNKAYLKLMKDGKELNSSIVNTNENGTWNFNLTVLNEKDTQVMLLRVKDVFQGTESSLVEIEGRWLVDYLNATEVKSENKYGKFECDVAGPTNLTFTAENVSLSADSDIELGAGIFAKTEKNFEIGGHDEVPTATDPNLDKFYLFKTYTVPGTYEIRSSIFDYTVTTPPFEFNFENFSAFYYDMDNSVDTENMTVTITGDKVLEEDLEYTTKPRLVDYAFDWTDQYYIMGLFGEKYVPFNVIDLDVEPIVPELAAEKMAKLVIDDDVKYTLKTGATMELGEGYTLIVDQIDVDGNKAYLKFLKDGKELNSSIVNTNDNNTWILRQTLLTEKNVQTLRVNVKDVFQGTQDSLVEIDGVWLIDYQNATELKSGDKFGLFEYTSFQDGILTFLSESNLTLTTDMDKQIANNMYLKTADNATVKNAYFYVKAEIAGNTTEQPPVDPTPTEPVTPPVDTPDNVTPPAEPEPPEEPAEPVFEKYMYYIIGAIVLIIIIAGAAYYFMVMKKA